MTVEQIVDYAKKNNQSSIAITNHGYLSSFVSFGKYAKKKGIKAIYGVELYDVDNPLEKADTKDYQQKRYHLILLAKNHQGLLDLFKIVSTSCTTFRYKKPLMSVDWIKENNLGKNIIALSACQAGRVSRLLINDKEQEAKEFVEKLQSIFSYVALEIQSHSTESQIEANKKIYSFVNKYNYPYVFTTDAHMVSKDQQETHSIFVQISEDREVGESYTDCFLQNKNDIKEILGTQFEEEVLIKGMAETTKISDMIEDIDIGLNKGSTMPVVKIQEEFKNNEEYLRHLVYKDFDVKFKNMSEEDKQVRRDRIETELPILYKSNFTDYFIMLYMLVQESNNRGIPRGYSRGSGANCLCLYMLGVTQIDSIRWDLDFSRFANLGRKNLADFDWDISKLRRKEFVEISEQLFGKENVAPICTFNTLSTKVAIRDIGKVLNDKEIYSLPYPLRDETSKMIPVIEIINESGEKQEKEIKLKEALLQNSKLAKIAEEYPLWIKYVVELEGLPKSMGRHAAGTLITPTQIIDYCPICQDSEGNIMTQIEMHSAMDDLGLVKMDYLGLETVDIVDNTLKLAGLTWEDVNINNIDLDDKRIYDEVYKTGNTTAVFQMESFESKSMCIDAETDNIEDVIAINAFNRPGTKESFPIYCFNKKNPNNIDVLHPDLREIFSKTYFVLLYQEQALQMFRYAGFPEDEVDNARRCIDENSLIFMADGNRKKIKDICIGDIIVSVNKNNVMENKKVINVFDNGYSKTYKITTQQGNSIIATNNHKVLTQNGWKEIKELSLSDYIMTPKTFHSLKDNIHPRYKPSEETMFMLGLLIGDGSIGNEDHIHFTNHEEVLINKFQKCISMLSRSNKECEFTTTKQVGVNVDYIYSSYVKTDEYKKELLKLLIKFNLIQFAGAKRIPDEFMLYPIGGKLKNLIAGLFNTDGGYNIQNTMIQYYTTSKELAYQIKSLLFKYNIYSYIDAKIVKDYNYLCYTVEIRQNESLISFEKNILPQIVGEKYNQYKYIIDKSKKIKDRYDFILPEEYYKEILFSSEQQNKSFSDISNYIGGYKYNGFKLNKNAAITNKKAKNIINYIYAPRTYELLLAEYIPLKVEKIEENESCHVFDIEVEDNHNYIANELIVHNCIGKKEKKSMEKLQVQLENGLKNKGWNENQIEKMWQLLLKQAEYSFGRGHSVAYSLMSYLTAYLKTYYPCEFFASCLSAKSDNLPKLSVLINECQRLNIKILPPNINKSGKEFTPLKDKNSILFGLLGIKGIGETLVEKIIEEKNIKPFENINDFILRTGASISQIVCLVKAGAIPTKNKKDFMLKYASSLFDKKEYSPVGSTPSAKILLERWGLDINKIEKDKRLLEYNKIREKEYKISQQIKFDKHIVSFEEKYLQDEDLWEYQTLSMFLSNNPFEESQKYIRNIEEVEVKQKGVVIGVISEITKRNDKNGKQFAYLKIFSTFDVIEIIVWHTQYSSFQDLIKKGQQIAILCKKTDDNRLVAESIKTYDKWLEDRKIKK
jgi:DNA polymerase-3 subunit alpha